MDDNFEMLKMAPSNKSIFGNHCDEFTNRHMDIFRKLNISMAFTICITTITITITTRIEKVEHWILRYTFNVPAGTSTEQ